MRHENDLKGEGQRSVSMLRMADAYRRWFVEMSADRDRADDVDKHPRGAVGRGVGEGGVLQSQDV